MAQITGKIAILNTSGVIIGDEDLGNVTINVPDGTTMPLQEIRPTINSNQVIDTFSYNIDSANGIAQKIWTYKTLGPADFPLTPSQLRLGLVRNNVAMTYVANVISKLPSAELQQEATVWWNYSTVIHWEHPETQLLMSMLNIPTENLANMWMTAKDYK